MSLVNLAHVCSHLQNASLARLGLTSIPFSRLHLSLALLLHKQGFLSQVKIAGRSPPASAFPAAVAPDNHYITGAPHKDRRPGSGEAALHDVVFDGRSFEELEREGSGYGVEALEFAREHGRLSKEQLERDGWDRVGVDFIMEHHGQTPAELAAQGLDATALSILETHDPMPAFRAQLAHENSLRAQIAHENSTRDPANDDDADADDSPSPSPALHETDFTRAQLHSRLRTQLLTLGFPLATLAYFAGPVASRTTPRHLAADGITLTAMGQPLPNQPLTTLPPLFRDPAHLEEEGVLTQSNRASRRLWLGLKYSAADGKPVLSKARLVSKPTKRIWLDHRELGRVVRGGSAGEVKGVGRVGEVVAVSTDRGVLEARECVERRVGGMVLCRVW
ncbi:hypothetical protein LTR08_003866 [Meristemomyces frigidus]|nr:hypothetical protein LTR08_003866 [Meristemomyces frigidus]